MDTRLLQKIDLNLLLALQILLEERSVSRAAARLYITQPAMSKTLTRLRDVFRDPLFIRGAHGMRPTPRAEALRDELSQVLYGVQKLVSEDRFDPAQTEREFTISISDYIGLGILPPLMARMSHEAPGIRIKAVSRVENQLEKLADGTLDVSLHTAYANYPGDIIVRRLGSNELCLMLRESHPALAEKTPSQALLGYPMIQLYIPDVDKLEFQQTAAQRRDVRVAFETSHVSTAMEVLRRTDFIMPGPEFLLYDQRASSGITSRPIPLNPEDQLLRFNLARHRRTANSPAHNWFWRVLIEIADEVRGASRVEIG